MLDYRKHNLRRAFADFLFDPSENESSSQSIPMPRIKGKKPCPVCDQNGENQLKLEAQLERDNLEATTWKRGGGGGLE